MKIKVGIFFGGKSTEHEVSVISGIQAALQFDQNKYEVVPIYISKKGTFYTGKELLEVSEYKNMEALLNKVTPITLIKDNEQNKVFLYKYPFGLLKKPLNNLDVALPVMHGNIGENGGLQGYFEVLDLPYAECGVLPSAVGMDKVITKYVLKSAGIPVIDGYGFYGHNWLFEEEEIIAKIEVQIGYPLIIKPATGGSSIGITIAANRQELKEGVELARSMAEKIIVEKLVQNIKEVNCSVLGDSENAVVSICEEPVSSKDILSFDDKYTNNSTKGMSSAKRKIPADIAEEMAQKIQDISRKAFILLGCSGVIRIDYIIDQDTNTVYLNELNTIPGSLSFYLWEQSGKKYPDLLDELITLAVKRHKKSGSLTYSYENNLFSTGAIKGFKK
jgi:D-alanine-D-alanine ligase